MCCCCLCCCSSSSFHSLGPTIEVQYKLLSFGISPHALPINASGEVVTDGHHRWLQLVKQNEADTSSNTEMYFAKAPEESQGDCSLNTVQRELLDMPMEDIDIDLGDMMDTELEASDDIFVNPWNHDRAVAKAQKSVPTPDASKSSNVAAQQQSDTGDEKIFTKQVCTSQLKSFLVACRAVAAVTSLLFQSFVLPNERFPVAMMKVETWTKKQRLLGSLSCCHL